MSAAVPPPPPSPPSPPSPEALIARLASDLRPVRRVRPLLRTGAWLALAVGVVAAAVALEGPRHDLAERMAHGHEVGQWLASVATGALAAVSAAMLAMPDRSRAWALLPVPALALWVGSLGLGCLADAMRGGPEALVPGTSWGCLRFILALGVPLTAAALWLLRHAAGGRPGPVAAMAGLASAALCSAGLSLFHHLDAAVMVLLWHGGAAALLAGLAALAGRGLLPRLAAAPVGA